MNEKEYVVLYARARMGTVYHYYTDSRKEAEEVYNQLCKEGWYAEMLYGTPGHYEKICGGV